MDRIFEATFDDQGHFEMPADLRERHGFTPGTKVKIVEDGLNVRIEKLEGTLIPRSVDPKKAREALEKIVGFSGTDGRALKTLLDERKRF
jgi:bifunctional DNA-binding transcriptional regulator/antitoxin component of YhaV-PrlF toxin-antitoxin module